MGLRDRLTSPPAFTVAHRMFEQHAVSSPDAVAVVFERQRLTYGELNRRAEALAALLQSVGADRDVPIAVYLRRCPELVIAFLGIWKCGATCVPIDPSFPQDRVDLILRDTAARIALTDRGLAAQIEGKVPRVFGLDAELRVGGSAAPRRGERTVDGDQIATIFYTSGSTGTPKGVLLRYCSVSNVLTSYIKSRKLAAGSACVGHRSVAFDATLTSLAPLCSGARLVLANETEAQDIDAMIELLHREQIEAFGASPALWSVLNSQPDRLPALTMISSSAEALSPGVINDLPGSATIGNAYGPTETTVAATAFEERLDVCSQRKTMTVPIGRPIQNVEVHVLSKALEHVANGAVGELLIGGVGLARGYLNDAALTAAKFVPNPFGVGERLYKSGDEGRWLPDGNLEFTGRLDRQAKIRGFRVEPGEVESVIQLHPAVENVAVQIEETAANSRQIVAYVSARASRTIDADEIRTFVAARCPHYLVPARCLVLPKLPCTVNGKIDYAALSAMSVAGSDKPFEAPESPVEQTVHAIARDVLRIERIDMTQDFLALGVDSLKATQIVSRIRDVFRVSLSPASFLEAKCLSRAARLIEQEDVSRRAHQISAAFLAVQDLSDSKVQQLLESESDRRELMSQLPETADY